MNKVLVIVAILVSQMAYGAVEKSYDFLIDGIYYSYIEGSSEEVEIVGYEDNYTFGELVITGEIKYNDLTYRVTNITEYGFAFCSSLTAVTVQNCNIENNAFISCTSLVNVELVNCTVEAGSAGAYESQYYSAFYLCTSINTLVLTDCTIGQYAFSICNPIENVTITGGVLATNSFEKSTTGGTFAITNLELTSVESIGNNAFSYYTITSAKITDCTIDANAYAFTDIKELELYESEIGEGVFQGLSSLTTLVVEKSIIDLSAFSNCEQLADMTIIDTEFAQYAFESCHSLTHIKIERCTVGEMSFTECENLTKVELEECTLEQHVFNNCTNLETVTISHCEVGNSAFWGVSISELDIEYTSIGQLAFSECAELTNIHIIGGSIGERAFQDCVKLSEVKISDGCEIGENIFNLTEVNDDAVIESLIIENCTMSEKSFYETSVVSLSITNSDVPASVFYGCSLLESVTLSGTINSIGDQAFYGCTSLVTVTTDSLTAPTLGTDAFSVVDDAQLILSCDGGYSSYVDEHWDYYFAIIGYDFYDGTLYYILYVTSDGEEKLAIEKLTTPYTGDIVIPAEYKGYEVGRIAEGAFTGSNITSLTICTNEVLNDVNFWDLVALAQSGCVLYVPEIYASDYWIRWGLILPDENIIGDSTIEITLPTEDTEPETSSISQIVVDIYEVARYNLEGQRINAPEKGINIVRYSDGTSRKELVR